jgi:hypothetical protein
MKEQFKAVFGIIFICISLFIKTITKNIDIFDGSNTLNFITYPFETIKNSWLLILIIALIIIGFTLLCTTKGVKQHGGVVIIFWIIAYITYIVWQITLNRKMYIQNYHFYYWTDFILLFLWACWAGILIALMLNLSAVLDVYMPLLGILVINLTSIPLIINPNGPMPGSITQKIIFSLINVVMIQVIIGIIMLIINTIRSIKLDFKDDIVGKDNTE